MAATASCMAASVLSVRSNWEARAIFLAITIDVAMLCIYYDPIETTTGNDPRDIAAREHLPGSKAPARASMESFLKTIGCLHRSSLFKTQDFLH